jgi:hypothetical protein
MHAACSDPPYPEQPDSLLARAVGPDHPDPPASAYTAAVDDPFNGIEFIVLEFDPRGGKASVLTSQRTGLPYRRGRVSPLRGRRGVAGDWADGNVPVSAGRAAAWRSRWCGALLGDRVAAVHDQALPGDVGCAGAGQPGNCGGDLVG